MTAKRPFRLSDHDIQLLIFTYQCRLVTIDHLITLTRRSRRKINDRLVRLVEHGYLYRRQNQYLFQKYIYTIHRNAVPILVEQGIAPKEDIDVQTRRLREVTDLFLQHALMITDIHVALAVACRESEIKLVHWQEGQALWDYVPLIEQGKKQKLPIRPDAFFTLEDSRREDGQNRVHFFLEADRSTATHARFHTKLKAYSHYHHQGLHTKKYGIKNFRVLTVTLTEPRASNLCKAAGEVLPPNISKFYYFAPISHFSWEDPQHIFEAILAAPRDFETGIRYQLMPPLIAHATTTCYTKA